jgi:hypothetical protein
MLDVDAEPEGRPFDRLRANGSGFGLSPRSVGLRPYSVGLSTRSFGLRPHSVGLSTRSFGLSPRSFGLSLSKP